MSLSTGLVLPLFLLRHRPLCSKAESVPDADLFEPSEWQLPHSAGRDPIATPIRVLPVLGRFPVCAGGRPEGLTFDCLGQALQNHAPPLWNK